jgi:hypothetical protein
VSDWLVPRFDTIPPELQTQPWLLWRGEDTGGPKLAKVPYCPRAPWRRGSSTDPRTWADFATVVHAYRRLPTMSGLGVVLTPEANIACIDLDHALDEAGLAAGAVVTSIVEYCRSWTEMSPSGLGIHIFGRGTLPRAVKTSDGKLEAYSTSRFIAVTGRTWTPTPHLADLQSYLDFLTERFHGVRCTPRPPTVVTPAPDDLAGALVNDLQRWGVQVRRLRAWDTGYAAEVICPWADEHTSGTQGTVAIIHGSGARSFVCQHAHCADRTWRDFFREVAR